MVGSKERGIISRVHPKFKKKVDEIHERFIIEEGTNFPKTTISRMIAEKVQFDDVNFFKPKSEGSKIKFNIKRSKKKKKNMDVFGDVEFSNFFR